MKAWKVMAVGLTVALAAVYPAEACSGPGAATLIGVNRLIGTSMALAACPLALMAWLAPPRWSLRHAVRLLALAAMLTWVYFAVTYSSGGDCGRTLRMRGIMSVGLLGGAAHAAWLFATVWSPQPTAAAREVAAALFAAPVATVAAFIIAAKILGDIPWGSSWAVFGGWLIGLPLFAMVEMLPVHSLSRRGWRRAQRGLCRGCGYDLRGSPGPSCPECGAEIRHADRSGHAAG